MEESAVVETDFLTEYRKIFHIKPVDAASYSPLVLAYMGDAVYELMIRTKIVNEGNMQVHKMHRKSSGLVKAEAQARIIKSLEPELTPEEMAVYKRGRNAKSGTMAKHAAMIDYRMATGFEALIGYLFLTEQFVRLVELTGKGLERLGEFEPDE